MPWRAGLTFWIALAACAHEQPHLSHAAVVLLDPGASGRESGSVRGFVRGLSGEPLPGATIVTQGPAGEQAEVTDDNGHYAIAELVPGDYVIRFYFGQAKAEAQARVAAGAAVQVDAVIEPPAPAEQGYIGCIRDSIDISRIQPGATLTQDFTRNVPVR